MPVSSKKISRLEREAILRAKDFEYKREQTANLLTNSNQDEEDFENDRHRRQEKMRQTRQIQREIGYQLGTMDRLNERKQQELQKKQVPTKATTTRSNLSSSSASSASASITDRASRGTGATETYSSNKNTSGGKLH